MKSNILALVALGFALACAVFFYGSACPQHSFLIGSMVTAGSAACERADSDRQNEQSVSEKILNGGI
jgi:hypothetical protein